MLNNSKLLGHVFMMAEGNDESGSGAGGASPPPPPAGDAAGSKGGGDDKDEGDALTTLVSNFLEKIEADKSALHECGQKKSAKIMELWEEITRLRARETDPAKASVLDKLLAMLKEHEEGSEKMVKSEQDETEQLLKDTTL